MVQLNFEKDVVWYMGVEFEDSHLVTDKNYNKDLGISSIIMEAPKGNDASVLASVTIRFTNNLEVEGTVYAARNGADLHFGTKQQKLKRLDGVEYWRHVDVKVPMAISAQVLRYAETKRKEEAMIPAATQAVQPAAPIALTPEQIAYYSQMMKK